MITILEEWCKLTGMQFNLDKCSWVRWNWGAERQRGSAVARDAAAMREGTPRKLRLCGSTLEEVHAFKLLGARFDETNSTAHLTERVAKAHERVARIDAFKGMTGETKARLMRECVITMVTYAPLAFTATEAMTKLNELQVSMDTAVRTAA